MDWRRTAVVIGVLAWTCASGFVSGTARVARADNAFPSSQSVLLPVDRPQQVVVGTTFGLVFSEDDGATWAYSCEQLQATPMGRQYRMGPPPDNRIYAVSNLGAPVSADGSCTWRLPRGPVAALLALDVWPDPSLPSRSYLLALNPNDQVGTAYRSNDGGLSYQGPIFTAEDATITGIESAASDPSVVYITLSRRADGHAVLVRSSDGGDTWTERDIAADVGAVTPRLVAVDPADPARVLLLLLGSTPSAEEVQGVALTTDGGITWRLPLTLPPTGTLTGFTRLPDGTMVLVGNVPGGAMGDGGAAAQVPTLFRSEDDGRSFTAETLSFHAVGLAQRDGTLFAAADNFRDGFALTSSADGGRTWRPRLKFREIAAVKSCVRALCADDCDYQAGVTLFPPETCQPRDAGTDGASADPPRPKGSGCACAVGAAGDGRGADPISVLVLLAIGGMRHGRRSHGRALERASDGPAPAR